MEQLNKVNQDKMQLKKAYKKKIQQNQVLFTKATQQNQASETKAMTPTKDTDIKTTKAGKNPFGKQTENSNKTALATLQPISASHMPESETDSESDQENNQEQLDMDILLNTVSDNE